MTKSNNSWQHVVHQSSFLYERVALGWIAEDDAQNGAMVIRRRNRWQKVLSTTNEAEFARRLSWMGIDEAALPSILGAGRLAQMPPASTAWIEVLVAVMQASAAVPVDSENGRLLQPFLTIAWERLGNSAAPHLDLLSPQAKEQLTHYLAERLTEYAQPTLTHLGLSMYLSADGFDYLYRTYPVLMRQLATTVSQWEAEVAQFLRHLVADWSTLAIETGGSNQPIVGVVRNVQPGLSDPHQGGCTVWRVELEQNITIAYKPKNIAQDHAWNQLIQWCNAQGIATPLAHIWIIPRPTYGWMAWVQVEGVADTQTTASYHHQVGMILGLLTLLHASDGHEENLIKQGQSPVLIDAEMVPYPQMMGFEAIDTLDVMRTTLLPRWSVGRTGYAEIGGLRNQSADGDAVQHGYQAMNHFLRQQWATLHLPHGPLDRFRTGMSRFAPRPTGTYHRLLTHLRHPACLVNGIDFSIEADRLAATFLRGAENGRFISLLTQEHQAIAQGDVPIFHVEIGNPDLIIPDATIENCFSWPAIQAPTVQDETVMVGLIRESLDHAPYFRPSTTQANSFLAQAILLGEQLRDRAIHDQNGAANWVAIQYQPRSGLYQHQLLADDFYSGRAGVALFLAALSQADKAEKWGNLASAAKRPFFNQPIPNANGGRLYAHSQIGQWLEKPTIATPAATKPKLQEMGIVAGQAGLIIGWIASWQQSHQPSHLNQAIHHGEIVLALTEQGQDETRWIGGFSHGAAGIAYAFTKLYEACGQTRFLDAARQQWTFQRTLYDTPPGLWQDRRGETAVYLQNWCHGAAGIGVAAIQCLDTLPDLQDIVERITAVLSKKNKPPTLDTLCCGQFGQVETLLELGLRLHHNEYVEQAANSAQIITTNATKNGYFQLYDDIPARLFNPTFFRGAAGIGYTFLRLAAAQHEIDVQFPCALGWAIN